MQSIRLLVVAVLFLALADTASSRPLVLGDYLNWEQAANPQVSPDGERILYTRVRVNPVTDGMDSEVWQMDADGDRKRFLLKGGGAQWSPTGDRVAFIAPANGKAQLFVRWMDDEGSVSQITHGAAEPKDFRWSPDGEWIAFRAEVPLEPAMTIELPGRPAGAEWTEDPAVIGKLHYRVDGVGMKTGYNHLFVVPAVWRYAATVDGRGVGRRAARFYGIDAEGQRPNQLGPPNSQLDRVQCWTWTRADEAGGCLSRGFIALTVGDGKDVTPLVEDDGSWGSRQWYRRMVRHIVYMGNRPVAQGLARQRASGHECRRQSNNRLLRRRGRFAVPER